MKQYAFKKIVTPQNEMILANEVLAQREATSAAKFNTGEKGISKTTSVKLRRNKIMFLLFLVYFSVKVNSHS